MSDNRSRFPYTNKGTRQQERFRPWDGRPLLATDYFEPIVPMLALEDVNPPKSCGFSRCEATLEYSRYRRDTRYCSNRCREAARRERARAREEATDG